MPSQFEESESTTPLEEKIIDGIWHDISERSGFDITDVSPSIAAEIRNAWRKIITDAIDDNNARAIAKYNETTKDRLK